jgi:transposase-like protein
MARQGERDVGKERFWRRLMALWRRSQPMTVRDFCAEHGVSEPSFYGWRRTLAQRDHRAPPRAVSSSARHTRRQADEQAKFVPLRIVPGPTGKGSADLQVVLGSGRIVRVPPGFDAATLRQLLVILEEERPC